MSEKLLWACSEMQTDGIIHVYPLFGEKHELTAPCWCAWHYDWQTVNLVIHEVSQ